MSTALKTKRQRPGARQLDNQVIEKALSHPLLQRATDIDIWLRRERDRHGGVPHARRREEQCRRQAGRATS